MKGNNDITKILLEGTKELLVDYSEIRVDQFLNDGFLKEIPILKSFVSAINLGKTINNAYFYKKLVLFVQNIQEITKEIRDKFKKKYYKDTNYLEKDLLFASIV